MNMSDNGRWCYERIKKDARAQGVKVAELLALAVKNDPFYTGRPAEKKAAEWFADLWERFGYTTEVHLRRVHYRIDGQKQPIKRHDGKLYENTETDWDHLCEASKHARYLGLVAYDAFVDRKNPEAKVYTDWSQRFDPRPRYGISSGEFDYEYTLPDLPDLDGLPQTLPGLPDFSVMGYLDLKQDYHVEVWCEKNTMNDILVPLCRTYGTVLVTGAGELSITAVVDFFDRARRSKRPARILYISDFDMAGTNMPVSVARKIEFFQRENGDEGLDIRLQPIILTAEQVVEYDLPRKPGKDSDKRKSGWEATHGKGVVELDALEALHPGELARIVEEAILVYYDPSLQERADEVKREMIADLDTEREAVLKPYQDGLEDLEQDYVALLEDFGETQARFAELIADFQPQIEAYKDRLQGIREHGSELYEQIQTYLRGVEMDRDDYALPKPDLPPESDGMLYVSDRDYIEQLEAYKAHRHGGSNGHG